MQRREFLVRLGGVLISAPALLEIAGCGDDGGPANPGGAATSFEATNAGDGSGHPHSFVVQCADLGAASTVTYTATGSHNHSVQLTVADLQNLAAGGTVTKNTTDLHPHTWTIRKPSGVC